MEEEERREEVIHFEATSKNVIPALALNRARFRAKAGIQGPLNPSESFTYLTATEVCFRSRGFTVEIMRPMGSEQLIRTLRLSVRRFSSCQSSYPRL